MSKIRSYCYKNNCGPVVKTGFHLEEYFVCRECKEEITERLATEIKDRVVKKEIVPDGGGPEEIDPFLEIYGFSGYIPNKHDDLDDFT